jgi:hypothetical protein
VPAGPAGISIVGKLRGTDIGVGCSRVARDVRRRAQRLNHGQRLAYPMHRLHQARACVRRNDPALVYAERATRIGPEKRAI